MTKLTLFRFYKILYTKVTFFSQKNEKNHLAFLAKKGKFEGGLLHFKKAVFLLCSV